MQRAKGAARVAVAGAGRHQRLKDLYQSSPCKVLMPRIDGVDGREAVLANTAGGVAGGDRLSYAIGAADGAYLRATTQASEKVYGAIDSNADLDITLSVANGATLEWVPQQTIAFDKARLRRRTTAHIHSDARLLALDWLVLGRHAHGEIMQAGALRDHWRIYRDDKLVWADAFKLDGAIDQKGSHAALLRGHCALAVVIYAAPDAEDRLDAARDALEGLPGMAGATCVNGLLVTRFLASNGPELQGAVSAYLDKFRAGLPGLPSWPPRVWTC